MRRSPARRAGFGNQFYVFSLRSVFAIILLPVITRLLYINSDFRCMSDLKQVILVRADLKLSKGKMSAQVAHASVEAVLKSDQKMVQKWRAQGMKKSILKVADLKELRSFVQLAEDAGLVNALISDAGRTHLEPGTITCLSIGPDVSESVDAVTGKLHLIN